MSLRILLVDDHTMFRQALRMMLEKEPGMEVVGEVGDGAAVCEAVARLAPDVVVMDVNLPNRNGMEATRELLASHPRVHVVALSAYGYKQFVLAMLDAGAQGYVLKTAASDQLVQAITRVAQGQTYLCPESTATLVRASQKAGQHGGQAGPHKDLGRRESEVLALLAQGMTSPQIGKKLHISPSTVEVHRRNIMEKLDLHSVAELTKHAIRMGLTSV